MPTIRDALDGETSAAGQGAPWRRVLVLALLLPLLTWVGAGAAAANESCHRINAKGTGHVAPAEDGDPYGRVRTVAEIHGGGLLQGTTSAVFDTTGVTPTGITFSGPILFTTNRGLLSLSATGTFDLTTGEFEASGPVAGRGKLAGADGELALAGVQDLTDPEGHFTETVTGEICVDLGGNGSR